MRASDRSLGHDAQAVFAVLSLLGLFKNIRGGAEREEPQANKNHR